MYIYVFRNTFQNLFRSAFRSKFRAARGYVRPRGSSPCAANSSVSRQDSINSKLCHDLNVK